MTAPAPQEIADLVIGTLRELGPMRFQQIAQNYQDYEVMSRLLRKDKVTFDTGYGIQRTLMTKIDSAAASYVGYTEADSTSIIDVLSTMQVNWVHATTSWALVYQTDVLMNRGKAMVLNVIKPRRLASLLGLVELLETKFWGAAPASTDKTNPWGIRYWVVYNATEGFNGGAASGNTTVAGVNLTDVPSFKNWSANYSAVSSADLILKMRKAKLKCGFKSPVRNDDYRNGSADRYRIYCNIDTFLEFTDTVAGQNEDLGRDIAAMEGEAYFHRHPIIHVPYLDDDTADPVYFIDFSTFYPVCLAGDYLRESPPMVNPQNHNTYQVFVDLSHNYLNVDRRRNAIFAKSALT